MLTCVYHPIEPMRVVEKDEADTLKESGVWFDSPLKAREYRLKVEDKIKQEKDADLANSAKPKAKEKGKFNER